MEKILFRSLSDLATIAKSDANLTPSKWAESGSSPEFSVDSAHLRGSGEAKSDKLLAWIIRQRLRVRFCRARKSFVVPPLGGPVGDSGPAEAGTTSPSSRA